MDKQSLQNEIGAELLSALPRDVSPREYFRGKKQGREFVLMLYPDATKAHLEEMLNFINIGSKLNMVGLKTPELYESNKQRCYSLFEDLGEESFGAYLRSNPKKREYIYELATDVLSVIGANQCLSNNLPLYNQSRINENRRQIVDYYMALQNENITSEKTVKSYLSIWEDIESRLAPCPQGFVHGDFHLENMIHVAHETGVRRCGLIDYQDALSGPLPYDLVNLLEDARVDVPNELRAKIIERYCKGMNAQDKSIFLDWYRVLGTQFHCRVIGLFIKLSAEQGRDSYLVHVNRLQSYISDGLQNPILLPLKLWFKKEGVDFDSINDLDGDIIRKVFRNISF